MVAAYRDGRKLEPDIHSEVHETKKEKKKKYVKLTFFYRNCSWLTGPVF